MQTLEPEVGQTIRINNVVYAFDGIPAAPQFVYAEPGRKAKVYRIINQTSKRPVALKVFYQEFRGEEFDSLLVHKTVELTTHLKKIFSSDSQKQRAGLSVTNRELILPEQNAELLRTWPQLSHSILMEWLDGNSWGNLVIDKTELDHTNSLALANSLASVLVMLEKNNLAHCDLSGGNFVFKSDFSRVELVDIEDLFYPDALVPTPMPAGTEGYVPEWVQKKGLWHPFADRIAGAILLVEILSWQYSDIRAMRTGQTLFESKEFGHKSERYLAVSKNLRNLAPILDELFSAVWFCQAIEECPPLTDWENSLSSIKEHPKVINVPELVVSSEENVLTSLVRGTLQRAEALVELGEIDKAIVELKDVHQFAPDVVDAKIKSIQDERGEIAGNNTILANPDAFGERSRIEISQSFLDFDVLSSAGKTTQLKLKNIGETLLNGEILPDSWLVVRPTSFSISPGESFAITVSLRESLPFSQKSGELRIPNALTVRSNAGVEVIGATANFYKKRGSCLTAWLVVVIISNIFIGLFNLSFSTSAELAGIAVLGLGINITQIVMAVGILNWKKWAVYGFVIMLAINSLLSFAAGDPTTGVTSAIVPSVLLFFLVRPQWSLFE